MGGTEGHQLALSRWGLKVGVACQEDRNQVEAYEADARDCPGLVVDPESVLVVQRTPHADSSHSYCSLVYWEDHVEGSREEEESILIVVVAAPWREDPEA